MICRVSVSDKRSTIHFHKIEIDSHSSGSTARPARIGFCRRYSHFSDSNSFDLSKRSKQPSCQRQCVGSPSDTDGLQFRDDVGCWMFDVERWTFSPMRLETSNIQRSTSDVQSEKNERVKGIEPSCVAWEATVLPLNYTRGWRK